MTLDDVWRANRVMLVHFDSYSTALVFAKWDDTLSFPAPLSASSAQVAAPASVDEIHDAETVKAATAARLDLNASELLSATDFNCWVSSEGSLVRIHLLRFSAFDAPKAALGVHGAVFKPISELRRSARLELEVARTVFDFIMGGGGGGSRAV